MIIYGKIPSMTLRDIGVVMGFFEKQVTNYFLVMLT
jgi:hypothetical protein